MKFKKSDIVEVKSINKHYKSFWKKESVVFEIAATTATDKIYTIYLKENPQKVCMIWGTELSLITKKVPTTRMDKLI